MVPDDKKKVSAYVPLEVHAEFKKYTSEKRLSDSQAVIAIFREYFGVGAQASLPESQVAELKTRIEALEAQKEESKVVQEVAQLVDHSEDIQELKAQVQNLQTKYGELLNELLSRPQLINIPDPIEPKSGFPEITYDPELDPDPLATEPLVTTNEPSIVHLEPKREPLKNIELATRWNIGRKQIERARLKPGFFEWSKARENGKFGWYYNPAEKLYYPIDRPLAEPSGEPSSAQPSLLLGLSSEPPGSIPPPMPEKNNPPAQL